GSLRCRYPAALRCRRRRADGGARGGRGEARSDARDVQRGRSGPATAPQMRLRCRGPAEPWQGLSRAASLRRVGARPCSRRPTAASRPAALLMAERIQPKTVTDLAAAIADSEGPLEILSQGSKRCFGRPMQGERTLDLSRLSGVKLYEPDELVLTAGAGTPLREIEGRLSASRQV